MVSSSQFPDLGRPPALRPRRISRSDGAVLHLPYRTIKHMGAHADVTFGLLSTAFERVELPAEQNRLNTEIDFGRIVGHTSKVSTDAITSYDIVDFAYRHGRRYPSRIILSIPKPPTSLLTLVAKRDHTRGESAWELETAYLGSNAPLEPLSGSVLRAGPEAQAEVLDFWCRHALIYDSAEFVTQPFRSSWASLCERRKLLGPDGFPESGPYWTG